MQSMKHLGKNPAKYLILNKYFIDWCSDELNPKDIQINPEIALRAHGRGVGFKAGDGRQ